MSSGTEPHGSFLMDAAGVRVARSGSGSDSGRGLDPAGALLFDLCNVLYDDTMWSRWLFQLVSRMGHHVAYDGFWDTWQRDYQRRVVLGECDAQEALRAFLRGWGLTRGQIDEACAAIHARRRQSDASLRPLPGVKLGLAQLHAIGWTIGVVGNVCWTTQEVHRCIDRLGLGGSIDAAFSAHELARASAETSPYVQAARALRAAPEQTVFISANAYELHDARLRGLQTVSVQLAKSVGQRCAIDQLSDLVRVLRPAKPYSKAG